MIGLVQKIEGRRRGNAQSWTEISYVQKCRERMLLIGPFRGRRLIALVQKRERGLGLEASRRISRERERQRNAGSQEEKREFR